MGDFRSFRITSPSNRGAPEPYRCLCIKCRASRKYIFKPLKIKVFLIPLTIVLGAFSPMPQRQQAAARPPYTPATGVFSVCARGGKRYPHLGVFCLILNTRCASRRAAGVEKCGDQGGTSGSRRYEVREDSGKGRKCGRRMARGIRCTARAVLEFVFEQEGQDHAFAMPRAWSRRRQTSRLATLVRSTKPACSSCSKAASVTAIFSGTSSHSIQ